jgi:pimeloyl-ACP methyl ester carboxylesterase
VPGDPVVSAVEQALSLQPTISVPTINLASKSSAWPPDDDDAEHAHFTGEYEQRLLAGIGHNIPQEAPGDFAAAVIRLAKNL